MTEAKIMRAAAVVARNRINHDPIDNPDQPRELRRSHMNRMPDSAKRHHIPYDTWEDGVTPSNGTGLVCPYEGPWRWHHRPENIILPT